MWLRVGYDNKMDVDQDKSKIHDNVMITYVCGIYSYTYDPSFIDQYVVTRTLSSEYKKCTDDALK